MKIGFEAKGFNQYSDLKNKCTSIVENRLGMHEFIKSVRINMKQTQDGNIEDGIGLYTENGSDIYASSNNQDFMLAFKGAVEKLRNPIEKYRVKHFHGISK